MPTGHGGCRLSSRAGQRGDRFGFAVLEIFDVLPDETAGVARTGVVNSWACAPRMLLRARPV